MNRVYTSQNVHPLDFLYIRLAPLEVLGNAFL